MYGRIPVGADLSAPAGLLIVAAIPARHGGGTGVTAAMRGFTLIEILTVVIILGVLAAMVVPQLSTATTAARHSMLADDIRVSRTQVLIFKWQHRGVPAGYPGMDRSKAPTEAAFISQMTLSSTSAGETAAVGTDGFPYGPYMREIPSNPVNGKSSIQIIGDNAAFPTEADDSHGWIYQPSTVTFRADCTGYDDLEVPFIEY